MGVTSKDGSDGSEGSEGKEGGSDRMIQEITPQIIVNTQPCAVEALKGYESLYQKSPISVFSFE